MENFAEMGHLGHLGHLGQEEPTRCATRWQQADGKIRRDPRDAAQGLSHDQKCASLSGKTFFHFPSKEDTHDEYDTSVRRNPDLASFGSRPAPLVWRSEPGGAVPHPPGRPRGP